MKRLLFASPGRPESVAWGLSGPEKILGQSGHHVEYANRLTSPLVT